LSLSDAQYADPVVDLWLQAEVPDLHGQSGQDKLPWLVHVHYMHMVGDSVGFLSRVPTPPAKSSNVCVKFPGPGKSWKRNIVWDSVGFLFRIPTPPAKSWNVCKISKTWKVTENEFGPGKSQNLPGNDADAKIIS